MVSPVSYKKIKNDLKSQSIQQENLLAIFLCLFLMLFGLQLNLGPLPKEGLFRLFSIGFIIFDFFAHFILFKSKNKNSVIFLLTHF